MNSPNKFSGVCFSLIVVAACFGAASACAQSSPAKPAAEEFPLKLDGDVGVGACYTRSIVRGKKRAGGCPALRIF